MTKSNGPMARLRRILRKFKLWGRTENTLPTSAVSAHPAKRRRISGVSKLWKISKKTQSTSELSEVSQLLELAKSMNPSTPSKATKPTKASNFHPVLLTEFTIFSKLPAELRNEVWKYIAHQPRIIPLVQTKLLRGSYSNRAHLGNAPHTKFKAPAMLHTNREARQEGLRYFELLGPLLYNHLFPIIVYDQANSIYFNFAADTLLIDKAIDLKIFITRYNLASLRQVTRNLRYLAVHSSKALSYWPSSSIVRRLPSLEEITFVQTEDGLPENFDGETLEFVNASKGSRLLHAPPQMGNAMLKTRYPGACVGDLKEGYEKSTGMKDQDDFIFLNSYGGPDVRTIVGKHKGLVCDGVRL